MRADLQLLLCRQSLKLLSGGLVVHSLLSAAAAAAPSSGAAGPVRERDAESRACSSTTRDFFAVQLPSGPNGLLQCCSKANQTRVVAVCFQAMCASSTLWGPQVCLPYSHLSHPSCSHCCCQNHSSPATMSMLWCDACNQWAWQLSDKPAVLAQHSCKCSC
jgi:hypothetical protein